MTFDPTDYDLPDGFVHHPGDPAEDYIGPFFHRVTEDGIESAFRIRPHHCNMYGTVHGGLMMGFGDYTLWMPLMKIAADSGDGYVTITCNNEFMGAVRDGDLIIGRGELTRLTRSLAFVRATLTVGDKTVLTSSGVFKRIRAK